MLALDTSLVMDLLSGESALVAKAKWYFKLVSQQSCVVSSVLLTELVFHIARRRGSLFAAEAAVLIRNYPNLTVIDVTDEIAIMAGNLRNKYYNRRDREISFLDCIHLATAVISGATLFVTSDNDFAGVDEIKVALYR